MRILPLLVALALVFPPAAAQEGGAVYYLGAKWTHEPLKVYVVMQRGTESYLPSLLTALNDWSSALKSVSGNSTAFEFELVDDRSQADVVISVRKNTGMVLGITTVTDKRKDGTIDKVRITIAAENALGRPLGVEDFRNIARHEIGHALGLGHSTSKTDLMYYAYDFAEVGYDIYPSVCDASALLAIYYGDGFGEPNAEEVPIFYQC